MKYLFALLALSLAPHIASAQSAESDMNTLLWLQAIKSNPQLAQTAGLSNPVSARYAQMVNASLKRTPTRRPPATTAAANTLGSLSPVSSGVLETPVADDTSVAPTPAAPPAALPASARASQPTTGRLTPYQMCLRDQSCSGISARPAQASPSPAR